MPGVGLIRSKLRPSRWLSPKSKQSFTKRRLLITVSSKSFSARCANSVSKCSSDRHRESANAPVENIPKVPYLSAIPLRAHRPRAACEDRWHVANAVVSRDDHRPECAHDDDEKHRCSSLPEQEHR